MRKRQFTILSLLIFITVSCKQDTKQLPLENLNGYWNVYSAERNGKKTTLLNGAFFDLKSDNTIVTNVNGDTIASKYTLVDNSFTVEGMDSEFRIVKLNADSMTLFSRISKFKYNFYTTKSDNNK